MYNDPAVLWWVKILLHNSWFWFLRTLSFHILHQSFERAKITSLIISLSLENYCLIIFFFQCTLMVTFVPINSTMPILSECPSEERKGVELPLIYHGLLHTLCMHLGFVASVKKITSEMKNNLYADYPTSNRVAQRGREREAIFMKKFWILTLKIKHTQFFFFLSQPNLTSESPFCGSDEKWDINFFFKFLFFTPNSTLQCCILLQEKYFMSRIWGSMHTRVHMCQWGFLCCSPDGAFSMHAKAIGNFCMLASVPICLDLSPCIFLLY